MAEANQKGQSDMAGAGGGWSLQAPSRTHGQKLPSGPWKDNSLQLRHPSSLRREQRGYLPLTTGGPHQGLGCPWLLGLRLSLPHFTPGSGEQKVPRFHLTPASALPASWLPSLLHRAPLAALALTEGAGVPWPSPRVLTPTSHQM